MKMTTVLFDLDGTLLPMDNDEFTRGYFRLLTLKLAPHGYDPKQLTAAIWAGMAAMVKNHGSRSNEEAFWEDFLEHYGEKAEADKPLFEEFYRREFQEARKLCGYNPQAAETVHALKEMGIRTGLATNPIFPAVATEARIRWAGLEPSDFELRTTYENTGLCKPDPDYYRDIADRMKVSPKECVMVGNDVTEDMAARKAGMQVFLLTDCLINREHEDIERYPHGSFKEFWDFFDISRFL